MIGEVPARTRALIFDIDGTLVDSTEVHFAAWYQALAGAGIELDRGTFNGFFGKTNATILEEMAETHRRDLSELDLGSRKDRYFTQNVTMVVANRPVVEVAEEFHGRVPMAVATNEQAGIANMVLRAVGIAELFDHLATVEEVEHPKPAPDLFLLAAERLGVEPHLCHVFEDTSYGIEAALEAGMSVTDVRPFL